MTADVKRYIRNCHECKRAHVTRNKTSEQLQDFDTIFVMIDWLSKQFTSILCLKTTTTKNMTVMYIDHIYWNHDVSESIVFNRDFQFIFVFWNEFCWILDIILRLSIANHSQTDDQIEIMNQYIDQRLRPYVNYYKDNWAVLLLMMNYAQLTLSHDSINMFFFQLLYEYESRTSYDWKRTTSFISIQEKLSNSLAQEFIKRMHEKWEQAKKIMTKTQAKKKQDVNLHRRDVDFDVEDKVWISTKHWKIHRSSRKLDNQMTESFNVLEKKNHSFKTDLFSSMKVHSIFHVNHLCKDANDSLSEQFNLSSSLIKINEKAEYEVQEVLAIRKVRSRLLYWIQWIDYDEDSEWYSASNLKYSLHKLHDFHLVNSNLSESSQHLDKWLKAWENEIEDYENLNNDKKMVQRLRTDFFRREK